MQRFAGVEHADELREPTLSSLRSLGVMQPMQYGISILAIELLESAPSPRVVPECRLEVLWHRHCAGRRIRRFPAPVLLSSPHLADPSWRQATLRIQSLDRSTVDLRPPATLAAWCKPLPPP